MRSLTRTRRGQLVPPDVNPSCRPYLQPRGLRVCERVVVVSLSQDRRVDQIDDILECAQIGRIDYSLDTSSLGDDPSGGYIVLTVEIGAGQRHPCVTLIEPGFEISASTAPARSALGESSAPPARLHPLGRNLLPGLPAHFLFQPSLSRAARSKGSLRGPTLLNSLLQLLFHLRPLEKAA